MHPLKGQHTKMHTGADDNYAESDWNVKYLAMYSIKRYIL